MSIPTRIFGVRPLGGPSGCLGEDGSKIVHAVHGTPLEDRPGPRTKRGSTWHVWP
jgi:hypothetical protein